MRQRITRREMIRRSAVLGAGVWAGGSSIAKGYAANERLNIGVVGLGGRGSRNLNAVRRENIVSLCDVDDKRAGDAYERFPKARKFYDFRRMLDKMHAAIDAVVVSTPDHTHFHASLAAMQLGKHCYCEKPMAHSVWEVRTMTELAREKKLATQLGVQRHTLENVHRVVEYVKAGVIGEVTECHAWIGGDRGLRGLPEDSPPVPDYLKWDLWLGPAPARPYSPKIAPYEWRFWWDYGTGETGNWGCHILDIPFWALDLKYPTRVDASGPEPHPVMTSKSMETHFRFPARGGRAPVILHWYHTKRGPAVLREHNLPHFGKGVLFVGKKGMLLCDFDKRRLYPEEKFRDFDAPPKSIAKSPGFHKEWILACKGGERPTCDFDYSGPLTETVLLGNVAYRAEEGFDWDAKELKARGSRKAQGLIRTDYRKGWQLT